MHLLRRGRGFVFRNEGLDHAEETVFGFAQSFVDPTALHDVHHRRQKILRACFGLATVAERVVDLPYIGSERHRMNEWRSANPDRSVH